MCINKGEYLGERRIKGENGWIHELVICGGWGRKDKIGALIDVWSLEEFKQ